MGGFIENEQRIDQRRSQSRSHIDALDFSARESSALTIHAKISQSDFIQIPKAGSDFVQYHLTAFVQGGGEHEIAEKRLKFLDWQTHQIVDVEAGQILEGFVRAGHFCRAEAVFRREDAVGVFFGADSPQQGLRF